MLIFLGVLTVVVVGLFGLEVGETSLATLLVVGLFLGTLWQGLAELRRLRLAAEERTRMLRGAGSTGTAQGEE